MIHIINNQTILLETLIRWCVIGGRSIIGNQTKLKAGLSYHKLVGWGRLRSSSLIILFLHLHLVMYLFFYLIPSSFIVSAFSISWIPPSLYWRLLPILLHRPLHHHLQATYMPIATLFVKRKGFDFLFLCLCHWYLVLIFLPHYNCNGQSPSSARNMIGWSNMITASSR